MDFASQPSAEDLKLAALLYGRPKTWKTSGACTLSRLGGVLLFNCDIADATRFARRRARDPEGRIMEPKIPPYEVDQNGQPVKHVQNLMHDIMVVAANESQIPAESRTVRSIVVDPCGELYRRLLVEESARAKHPTFEHRLAVTAYMEEFFRFLCEVPNIHVVFVCHEMQADKGEEGLEFLPFTGSKTGSQSGIGPKLKGWVNIIAYTGVKVLDDGSKHGWAQLFPAAGRDGGDRFGGCLGDDREVDLAEWLEVIRAHEEGRPLPEPEQPAADPETAAAAPADPTPDSANGSTASSPASAPAAKPPTRQRRRKAAA